MGVCAYSVPVLRDAANALKGTEQRGNSCVAFPSVCHALESICMNLENSLYLSASPGGFSYNQHAMHCGRTALTEPKLQVWVLKTVNPDLKRLCCLQ